MARAIWSGSVTFGLVNIPVRLYNATSPKDVRFHEFQRGTGQRIRHQRVVGAFGDALPEPAFDDDVQGRGGENGAAAEAAPVPDAGEATANGHGPDGRDRTPSVEAVVRGIEEARRAAAAAAGTPRETRVEFEDVVKGYEVDRDRYVLLDRDELQAVEPEQTGLIEIADFVELADIDPMFFEKSYYLVPERRAGAERAYRLLLTAMRRAGKVGIATFVLRRREHLCAVRPADGALVLETLFFDDEVRDPAEVGLDTGPDAAEHPIPERELGIAEQLIGFLATDWDPKRYRDTYRERVLELIRTKAAGMEPVREEPAPDRAEVPDLMAALRASVEAAKRRREPPPSASPAENGAGPPEVHGTA